MTKLSITFDENEFIRALKNLEEKHSLSLEEFSIEEIDSCRSKSFEEVSSEISDDTELSFDLSRCEESFRIKAKEVIELNKELNCAKLIDNEKYVSNKRILYRMAIHGDGVVIRQLDDQVFISDGSLPNGKKYSLSVKSNDKYFAVLVQKGGDYDKYFPPILSDDLFVEIVSDDISPEMGESLFKAFIFEMSASHGIDIYPNPRPILNYLEDESENDSEIQIRPLEISKSLTDVYDLFSQAINTTDSSTKILFYVKIIEYISQTIIRLDLTEKTRMKLMSPQALRPDGKYIFELEKIFSEYSNNKKDNQSIKMTIETCVDIDEFKDKLPASIKGKLYKNDKLKEDHLTMLSSFISATRNQISHAKANYQLTGNEIPENDYYEFSNCLKMISQQCIRWYIGKDESQRIHMA